jgi:hypothetical protein
MKATREQTFQAALEKAGLEPHWDGAYIAFERGGVRLDGVFSAKELILLAGILNALPAEEPKP